MIRPVEKPVIPARKLLDKLRKHFNVRTNEQLAIKLKCDSAILSRMTHGKQGVGPHFILRVYDKTGISIDDIRGFLK